MIVVVAAVVVAICGCHSEYMVSLLLPASVPYPRCMHLHPWCVVQACEPTVSEASVPSCQPAYLSTVLGWGGENRMAPWTRVREPTYGRGHEWGAAAPALG